MILTIGIPVYNGEKFIKQTILSILQTNFDFSEVEILVSDNCSIDRTLLIVKEFPQIRIIQTDYNRGYDYNVNNLFNNALGDYVWLFGADDVIIKEDISEIIEMLRSPIGYGVIFVGESRELSVANNYLPEDFFIQTDLQSGFISNNIFNKNCWIHSFPTRYIGSNWIHFGMAFIIAKQKISGFTPHKFVEEIPDSKVKSWTSGGKSVLIGLDLVDIIHNLGDFGYSKAFIKRSKMVIKGAYPKLLLIGKIEGLQLSIPLFLRFIKLYREFFTFWILDFWILVIPNFILRFFYSFLKKAR